MFYVPSRFVILHCHDAFLWRLSQRQLFIYSRFTLRKKIKKLRLAKSLFSGCFLLWCQFVNSLKTREWISVSSSFPSTLYEPFYWTLLPKPLVTEGECFRYFPFEPAYRHCTTTMALWRFLLERLMTAQAFENVNIYILFSKTRYLKPAATRHQLRGSIVYWQIIAVLSFIFKSAI